MEINTDRPTDPPEGQTDPAAPGVAEPAAVSEPRQRRSGQPCPSCGDTGWKPEKKQEGAAAACTCTYFVYALADAGSIYEKPRPLLLRPGKVYPPEKIDSTFTLRLLEDGVIRRATMDGGKCPACTAAAAAFAASTG